MGKRSGRIAGGLLPIVLGAVLLSGCGTATGRTDNAEEFREQVAGIGADVRLLPEREGRPDLVEGIVISKDGAAARFSFAFGPAPERNLPAPARNGEAVWFNRGDQVYYWVDYEFSGPKDERNRFYEAAFAVEDTACRVVADRDCGF